MKLGEILVVIVILGMLFFVADPLRSDPAAVAREAMSNLMVIADAMEDRFEEAASHRHEASADGCAASTEYEAHGALVGELPVTIQGEYFRYRVSSADLDGDGRCEWFQVSARGRYGPAIGMTLEIDSLGRRTAAGMGNYAERWVGRAQDAPPAVADPPAVRELPELPDPPDRLSPVPPRSSRYAALT